MRTHPGSPPARRAALCAAGALLFAAPLLAAPPPSFPRTVEQLSARLLASLEEPRALAELVRLSEQAEREADLPRLAAALEKVVAARRARADVRALAQHLLAQVRVAQGQVVQGRALADQLAVVRAWAVIGPFDNDGRRGFAAAFPPEREGVRFGARYEGKEHEVAWRALPDVAPLGVVDLGSAIAPRQEVVVYAATLLPSERARGAVLHLGASGACKVWLNGALVLQDEHQHPARLDQHAAPVRLQAGENRLLVKLAHGSGPLALVLRVADERGAPLPQVAKGARAPDEEAAVAPGAFALPTAERTPRPQAALPPLPKAADAVRELEARAQKSPKDARAQEDLAVVLATRRTGDDTERRALRAQEKAAALAPGEPEVELRLARLEDRDPNKRRLALERALAAHPGDAEVLEQLVAYRLERGEAFKALDLAEQAVAAAPASVTAGLMLARALDAVGHPARATALREELARAHPQDARAVRTGAQAQRRLGRAAPARAALERVLALRFDDAEARGELTGLLLDAGDLDGALQRLGEAVALNPGALGTRARAAELLSQNGRRAQADEAWAQALALAPDDADLREQHGRHLLRAGDQDAALEAFAASLRLRPQNPSLRELVNSVKPAERYAAPYLYDAAALAKEAAARPAAEGEDLEVLADLTVVKVFPNGLSSRTRQVVLRALTPRGVEQARVQSMQFAPDRQVVRVERARIVRPDGQVIEAKGESERSLSEPWYGLWYDVRARLVSFTQLQPGDTLEFAARLDDSGSNFFADYFGDFVLLQGTARKRVADYVLLGPPGRTFYAAAAPLPDLARSEDKLPDGGTRLRFTAREVPRVVPEPAMPGPSEVFAWLHVSTYADWESVGRFYWGLVKDQLQVTHDVRRAAEEAVRDVPAADELGRIRAVYRTVLQKTRYVGLEFGINSFKPYPVETILSRAFGDCKDKASLMYAMLQALGIDSRVVLLRMRRLGALQEKPASLAVFNHAILYVPKHQLFLDGTAEFHGSAELPGDDVGAEVLVVEPSGQGSRLVRTPEARPEANTEEALAQVTLAPDGSAALTLTARSRGAWTAELRRTFESPDERRTKAEEYLARGAWPGVKVTGVQASDPLALEAPFELRFEARLPSFGTPLPGGRMRFNPFGQRPRAVESWAQLSRRTLPMRLPPAQRTTVESRVILPPGVRVELPPPAVGEGPQGRWSVSYAQETGAVVARLTTELVGGQIGAADYPAWRAFLEKLDVAVARPLEAAPAGGSGL